MVSPELGAVIRPLSLDDEKLLLNWRNDPKTIQASVSRKEISEASHREWMRERIFNPLQSVFIYEANGVPVGTFTLILKGLDTLEISYMVAPDARGLGVGKAMLKAAVNSIRGNWQLIARARKENLPSQKVLEHIGMKFEGDDSEYFFYWMKK